MSFTLKLTSGTDRTPPALNYRKPENLSSSKVPKLGAKTWTKAISPRGRSETAKELLELSNQHSSSKEKHEASSRSPRELIAASYRNASSRKTAQSEPPASVLCRSSSHSEIVTRHKLDSTSFTRTEMEKRVLEHDPVHLANTVLNVLCDDSMRSQPAWIVQRQEKVLSTVRDALDSMNPDERATACNAILENAPSDVHPGQIRRLLECGLSVAEFLATLTPRTVKPIQAFRPNELKPSRSFGF